MISTLKTQFKRKIYLVALVAIGYQVMVSTGIRIIRSVILFTELLSCTGILSALCTLFAGRNGKHERANNQKRE